MVFRHIKKSGLRRSARREARSLIENVGKVQVEVVRAIEKCNPTNNGRRIGRKDYKEHSRRLCRKDERTEYGIVSIVI